MSEQGWQDRARCLGEDPVFMQPDRATRDEVAEAKRVCASCEVFDLCELAAKDQVLGAYGVWAGRWWGEPPVWEVERECFRDGCGVSFRSAATGPGSRSFCSNACRTAASRARNKLSA